jgi:hypothetical protein
MNTDFQCGECSFFNPNKDKHCSEVQCRLNPPTVFPHPVKKAITGDVVMSQIQFLPIVTADHSCGYWTPDAMVKPDLKATEN